MKTRIIAIGNSQGIRIPKVLLEQSGRGEEVELEVHDSQLVIRPAERPRQGWDEAFRAMAEQADAPNTSLVVEDGQSLRFDDGRFDAVLCSLGLMFFPDPMHGLLQFHRVLRPGGYAAASVITSPERSYNGRINVIMARRVPSLAKATARTFSLGDAAQLHSLFERAGFQGVETTTAVHSFVLPSFEAYFGPFEQGGGSSGQAYLGLPKADRRAVREELRRSLGDTGGPIAIEVELRFASGHRERCSPAGAAIQCLLPHPWYNGGVVPTSFGRLRR